MSNENQRERIAFVCQRYGLEVNGGAEQYCRQVAEQLTKRYDVTVYASCARDYLTWADYYPAGEETINGVRVKRYPVQRERAQSSFDRIHAAVLTNPVHSDGDEQVWIDEQGPLCPALIDALRQEHGEYKAVLFMTYLYYTTTRGMALDLRNAILIPTVHDEPPVYLRIFDQVFRGAKAIAWNTAEEREFACRRFPFVKDTPGQMTGLGIDGPQGELPEIPEELRGQKYLVYAGRIDESKGCREMFEYFLRRKRARGDGLKLVLMGRAALEIPEDPDIISLGFVTEEMKYAVMGQALALVLFSRFESLSMVVLESMYMHRPVLVTGACEVLKGHCVRSNAGLYFDTYLEFEAAVDYLLAHPAEYAAMCENGSRYVEENYRWDVIVRKYEALIDTVGRR